MVPIFYRLVYSFLPFVYDSNDVRNYSDLATYFRSACPDKVLYYKAVKVYCEIKMGVVCLERYSCRSTCLVEGSHTSICSHVEILSQKNSFFFGISKTAE